MPSVFSAAQTHRGGFRADQLNMVIQGTPVDGLVIQNVNFTFSQQVTMLYEIGSVASNFVYYVGGRTQGTASIARILGPAASQALFIENFGDLCEPADMEFDASSGCPRDGGGDVRYTLISAILTTLALSVTANDIVINETMQFMFVDMSYDVG